MFYLAASPTTVSAVLVKEKEHENQLKQFPIYFVSKALSGAKLNYTKLEKIAYIVVMASRKLKHYFQAHEIIVPSSQPLGDIFSNKEASRRIGKWATELSQVDLKYVLRTAIKSQALADFMADWTPSVRQSSPTQAQV